MTTTVLFISVFSAKVNERRYMMTGVTGYNTMMEGGQKGVYNYLHGISKVKK